MKGWPYWVLVIALIGFGALAVFSIGAPFLLLGVSLAVLASYRDRPGVFWPWVAGVLGFIIGYALVAPLSCVSEASSVTGLPGTAPKTASTTCSSVLGIHYSGGSTYNPPVWPGFLAGVALSVGAAALTRWALRHRERVRSAPLQDPHGTNRSIEGEAGG